MYLILILTYSGLFNLQIVEKCEGATFTWMVMKDVEIEIYDGI